MLQGNKGDYRAACRSWDSEMSCSMIFLLLLYILMSSYVFVQFQAFLIRSPLYILCRDRNWRVNNLMSYGACQPGGHCWNYYPGTLSCSQVWNSFEDLTSIDEMDRCPSFKWAVMTLLKGRAPGWWYQLWPPGLHALFCHGSGNKTKLFSSLSTTPTCWICLLWCHFTELTITWPIQENATIAVISYHYLNLPLQNKQKWVNFAKSALNMITEWLCKYFSSGPRDTMYGATHRGLLISPWTKWPPFRRRYFQMHLVNKKFCILIKISKFVTRGPIDNNPALVQIMAWRRIGDKPLS